MIIVEGPDGAGKSTLIRRIMQRFPELKLGPRGSTSGPHGGPVDDVFAWAAEDVASWPRRETMIYDRHPMISEYIYGPVVRQHIDPRFHTTAWHRPFAASSLVILCRPPLEVVRRAVSDERDMPGVATHIDTIWQLYASLTATWHPPRGDGHLITYDYTQQLKLGPADRPGIGRVMSHVQYHIETRRYTPS